ncbi:hypothetical protein HQ865_09555 [Mucilaginibacter mali]|uniref:Uncharacterized protein n=1 Tax=Mucilaginibacter mali TaxID=2740462 RepID=A0A7D4Q7H3_9SPHI|nr:hypothetical protein [Mucilaginibacter mali]QKJ29991.1 hypothetical protein HQ865_09555 [Mucilaginibacter mali]
MKKLIIISAMVLGGLGVKTADAQIGIRINLNLGSHPVYTPAPEPVVVNEPVYDDYYYYPEVEAYYSVAEHCYYYQDGDRWIAAAYLPGMYHNFDWRTARRFEIRTNRPFMHHDVYRGRFGGYVNRADFYARAYPGRDRYDRDPYRGREQYGNRGWNQSNRNDYDRRDDRDRGGRDNNYNQPQPDRNQGGYGQGQNNGGYNQQNPGRNQGGYGQPGQNQGGNQQPSRGEQGAGRGNGGNNGQPTNHGQDRGGNNGVEQHYAANKMGMIQDSREFAARPVRP